jgi:hypothetical protein
MFYLDKPLFDNLNAIAKNIAEFEKDNNIILKIKRSDTSKLFGYMFAIHITIAHFYRFGPDIKAGSKVRAKKSYLNHYGTLMKNRSKNNKRKRRQRLREAYNKHWNRELWLRNMIQFPKMW